MALQLCNGKGPHQSLLPVCRPHVEKKIGMSSCVHCCVSFYSMYVICECGCGLQVGDPCFGVLQFSSLSQDRSRLFFTLTLYYACETCLLFASISFLV